MLSPFFVEFSFSRLYIRPKAACSLKEHLGLIFPGISSLLLTRAGHYGDDFSISNLQISLCLCEPSRST